MTDSSADMPSLAEFRAAGYTWEASNWPLTEEEFLAKCHWNNVDPTKAPRSWRYAPNKAAKEYWSGAATASPEEAERLRLRFRGQDRAGRS